MQQLAVMVQCRSGNDAVVGRADGDALLSQLAINVSCPHEDSRPFAGKRLIAPGSGGLDATLLDLPTQSAMKFHRRRVTDLVSSTLNSLQADQNRRVRSPVAMWLER